jgi:hypothetical protein
VLGRLAEQLAGMSKPTARLRSKSALSGLIGKLPLMKKKEG